MSKKLLLNDLDGTVRRPLSDNTFIQHPEDQAIIPEARQSLKHAEDMGWDIIGVTNQGGIAAGYKTLKEAIAEQRITLAKCPQIQRIYFSVDDEECWCITRENLWMNRLPLWLNTRHRYCIRDGMGQPPRYNLGGFRKPNPGMVRLAIAEWIQRNAHFDGLISGFEAVMSPAWESQEELDIRMTGDRPEDRAACESAQIKWVELGEFWDGSFLEPVRSPK